MDISMMKTGNMLLQGQIRLSHGPVHPGMGQLYPITPAGTVSFSRAQTAGSFATGLTIRISLAGIFIFMTGTAGIIGPLPGSLLASPWRNTKANAATVHPTQ